jgi:hypothetical protein
VLPWDASRLGHRGTVIVPFGPVITAHEPIEVPKGGSSKLHGLDGAAGTHATAHDDGHHSCAFEEGSALQSAPLAQFVLQAPASLKLYACRWLTLSVVKSELSGR